MAGLDQPLQPRTGEFGEIGGEEPVEPGAGVRFAGDQTARIILALMGHGYRDNR